MWGLIISLFVLVWVWLIYKMIIAPINPLDYKLTKEDIEKDIENNGNNNDY
jgi:hypothetical protein|tara:strand:+ start:667 stop:819 length:153 start_codon:yes stop_codon:yes gene_type:complete